MDLLPLGIAADPRGPPEQRVACPQCSRRQRDTALGVNVQSGAFHCFRCGWKGRVGKLESGSEHLVARIDDPQVAARKRERLRATWRETVSLTHPKAYAIRRYLESRALGEILKEPPVVLRVHPGLEYWDGTQNLGRYPSMIALFHGAVGAPVTLHVTYLRADGFAKARVLSPKKILGVPVKGATKGGAIRLYEARAGILGIAEGIESALSLRLLRNIPVWASYCADNLARAHLPSGLRELHIALDIDESGKGEQVARALTERVKKWSPHTKVTRWRPEIPGAVGDLNDELLRGRTR